MTLDKANRIIRETSGEVPFNTFTCILSLAGIPYSELLGGDCVHHARLLMDLIDGAESAGADENDHGANYDHWGVKFTDSGDLFYADSSVGMMEAVNLTRLFADGKPISIDAFPVQHGEPSKVSFIPKADGRVRVIQEILTKPLHFVSIWYFDPDVSDPLPPINDREIPLADARYLHLKVFAPEGKEGESWLSVDTRTLQSRFTVFGSDGIEQRFAFSAALDQIRTIAAKVGHDPESLIELMKNSVRVRGELLSA